MAGDIDSEFLHDGDGLGPHMAGIRSGALHICSPKAKK
jgi:hypothetical protein